MGKKKESTELTDKEIERLVKALDKKSNWFGSFIMLVLGVLFGSAIFLGLVALIKWLILYIV